MPAPRPRPQAAAPVAESPPGEVPSTSPEESVAPSADAQQERVIGLEQSVVLQNDAVRVRVSNAAGRVEGIELVGFADRKGDGALPVQLVSGPERGTLLVQLGENALEPLGRRPWEIGARDERSVELKAAIAGVEVVQRLELDPTGYGARMRLAIRNRGDAPIRPRPQLLIYGQERPAAAPDKFLHYSLVWDRDGSVERKAVAGIGSVGFFGNLMGRAGPSEKAIAAPVEMAGADSQYFLLAAASDNPRETQALVRPLGPDLGQVLLMYGATELPPGTSVERSWRLYLGPKIPAQVRAVDPRFEILTDVGWHWVRPLVNLFAAGLKGLHGVVGNYGWAIIIITILLRIATFPLTQRSMRSMKKFGAIAPEMKALQEKYGTDRGKLQEEMMKLYREKGINPLSSLGGGCIPMLIQMPFMVALYFALQSSIELRHAPFLGWITDLSAPEDLHLFGLPVRLLPLMMGVSMVLQQRLTPSPTADPQQRQMMSMMSIMFVVLFYGFPSGLVLYWFVSNLLGIAQQLWVNRAPSPAT